MSKLHLQDTLWAGTEASLALHLEHLSKLDDKLQSFTPEGDDDHELPRLLSKEGEIGIVSIKGPMSNRESWFAAAFGAATYPAIRDALVAAAGDTSIKHILLDIDSGGGSVNGVTDVATLISTINDRVKPVTAFTDGMMASAAYWLGSSAEKVYASKVATVGSIGVITTHMEQSKALKEAGLGVTVMRAGKYKALANSVEPLTETAKAQIQEQLEAAYGVFVQTVADNRNVSYDVADKQMGQGKEFFGATALSAGLIDGVETFDSVVSRISADIIDKKTHVPENRSRFGISAETTEAMMARNALTEQQIAALAESAGEPAAAETPPAADAGTEPPAAAPEAPAAPEAQAGSELVSYLQAHVKELQEGSIKDKLAIATLTEKLATIEAVTGDLVAIAGKSLNNMRVACGNSATEVTGMNPLTLVTEHKRVSAEFLSKFKAGGVAAVDAAQTEKGESAVMDSVTKARLAATRFSK